MSESRKRYYRNHPKELEKIRKFFRELRSKQDIRSTQPEQSLIDLIYTFNLPVKYVGDGSFWIGGKPPKNPDFIFLDSKIIIEVFGDYWHSEEVQGVKPEQHMQDYINHYKKYGYKCLIFWENEVYHKKQMVVDEISKFV